MKSLVKEAIVTRASIKKAIRQEISWCKKHKDFLNDAKEYQRGFVAGLEQSLEIIGRMEFLEKEIKRELRK